MKTDAQTVFDALRFYADHEKSMYDTGEVAKKALLAAQRLVEGEK